MQVFKSFFKIAGKRLRSACIYFIIYTVIILVFSFTAESSFNGNFQSSELSLYIEDHDGTDASHALCAYLDSLHEVTTEPLSREEIADRMYYRMLNYVLIIPQGFEERLLTQNADGFLDSVLIPGSSNGIFVNLQVTQYIRSLQTYLAGGYTLSSAVEAADRRLAEIPAVKAVSFGDEKSVTDSRVFYFYQYLPYVFLLILFAGMAPILITMNEPDMRRRTLCSCLPASGRNLQLAAACTLYALLVWFLFMLLGLVIFRQDFLTRYSLLAMGNSLVFLLFCVAVTLFVSIFSPNENVLNMLSNIIGLSMSFLCGIFVPQNLLSDGVLAVGKFLPAYWYIVINDMLALSEQTFDLHVYLQGLGIQFLFAAAAFALLMAFSGARKRSQL